MRRTSGAWAASAIAIVAALIFQAGGGGVAAAAPSGSGGGPYDDPAAAQLAEDYGLPYDEALRRVNRQAAVGVLSRLLSERLPDKFGELWTDHAAGGTVVINKISEDNGFDRAVREAGLEGQVRYEPARFSHRDLATAFQDLNRTLASIQEPESYVGLSLDARNNRVTVDSAPGRDLTPTQQAWYEDARRRHGDLLARDEVAQGSANACAWPSCDPPLRGGLWINPTTNSSNP